MKLIIDSIDDVSPVAEIVAADLNKNFQRRVAAHFDVIPVLSDRAFETIEHNGIRAKATHVAFGLWAYGSASDTVLVGRMFDRIMADMAQMWPFKSAVVWRRFPEVEEYYDEETCSHCGHTSRDRQKVKITLRIGSPAERRGTFPWPEGEPMPQLDAAVSGSR